MKVELEKIELGHSPISDEVFAGIKNKAKTMWLKKINVTNSFLSCVIGRWENKKETIIRDGSEWEISVKKIK